MLFALLLLAALIGPALSASADEPAIASIYDVDRIKLKNGIDVILKKRTHAHSVAVRLVVGVGTRNFPCEKRETPHFLEHLLFMGTSKHSEAELARLVQDHGGAWNGHTLPTETRYQVDIFDKHLPLAINTLYEIMTDTRITSQTVESARSVIYREHSGKLSSLVQWFYKKGLFKEAGTKAGELLLPGSGVFCPGGFTPEGIQEQDARDAYHDYYVPSNMTLIVVGNFERELLVAQITATFGRMVPRAMNRVEIATPPHMVGSKEVSGTLAPLVGSDGKIGFAYRTNGFKSNSADYHALWVLSRYLKRILYEKIRVEHALAYNPDSIYATQEDFGLFILSADVNLDKLDAVASLFQSELENIRQGRIDAKRVDATKQAMLAEGAKEYESNARIADYFSLYRDELGAVERINNIAPSIASVTPEEIRRVANQYLRDDTRVVIRSTPTMTYPQFLAGLGFTLVGVPGASVYLLRRFIKRRRNRGSELFHGQT